MAFVHPSLVNSFSSSLPPIGLTLFSSRMKPVNTSVCCSAPIIEGFRFVRTFASKAIQEIDGTRIAETVDVPRGNIGPCTEKWWRMGRFATAHWRIQIARNKGGQHWRVQIARNKGGQHALGTCGCGIPLAAPVPTAPEETDVRPFEHVWGLCLPIHAWHPPPSDTPPPSAFVRFALRSLIMLT